MSAAARQGHSLWHRQAIQQEGNSKGVQKLPLNTGHAAQIRSLEMHEACGCARACSGPERGTRTSAMP